MMILNIKTPFLLLFTLFALISCEEVIDVDLNSADPVMVVDGKIYEGKNAYVRLTMTSDFFASDSAAVLSDAVVTLSDDKGHSEQMTYDSDGVYRSVNMLGEVGATYTLSVENAGKSYLGKTQLFAPVQIYDVQFSVSPYMRPQSTNEMEYVLDVNISEDTLVDNFYMLEFYNDTLQVDFGYFLISDIFTSNDTLTVNSRNYSFKEGTYKVKVFSIDESTYNYYNQLNDLDGFDFGGSTPYNPQSNFGRDVMGYFSAFSVAVDSGMVVVD